MAVFYVLVALALSLMHHFLSVENFAKLGVCLISKPCSLSFQSTGQQTLRSTFLQESARRNQENLTLSNSIFLHNVLGLSGACLINFVFSSARHRYPSCFSSSVSSSLLFLFLLFFKKFNFFFSPPPQTLASEILLDVQEVKQQLMNRRKLKQASSMAARNNLSAKSMIKAKSVAASILNMSENDLADIMEPDQVRRRSSRLGFHTSFYDQ